MTARDLWEALLVEINKTQAASLLVEDFNYLVNKAINQYVNKRYNICDINQQLTDDLRVLKDTAHLTPALCQINAETEVQKQAIEALYGATYEVKLPLDYRHLLNCVCSFKVNDRYVDKSPCSKNVSQQFVQSSATRMSSDVWGSIIGNYYLSPSFQRPYYYIHQTNSVLSTGTPDSEYASTTEDALATLKKVKDAERNEYVREISLDGGTSLVGDQLEELSRVSSPTPTRMEIRYGSDSNKYELVDVQVDYLRNPQHVQLTQQQLDLVQDTSQILEWPDYVCNEIINELTHLVMENVSDQRLQTHIPITNTIPFQQSSEV